MQEHVYRCTLKSLTASVCRACEGSVVRGDDRASLLKHNMGCLQIWESERQNGRFLYKGNNKQHVSYKSIKYNVQYILKETENQKETRQIIETF